MTITLDLPLTISEIKSALRISTTLPDSFTVRKITTDSRKADSSSLFIALDGKNISGNDFIISAKDKGAVTLGTSLLADITVSDSEAALLSLARYYKKKHLIKIRSTAAITGSVGKTTTKEFLCKLLEGQHKIHATYGNYNNTIGVPLTILSAPKDTEILICELGMNSVGEIAKLSQCLEPDVAVITNIGTSHIGNLGSKENIAKAKLEILVGMSEKSVLLVPYGEKLLESKGKKSFSASSKKADTAILGSDNLEIFYKGKKIGTSFFNLREYHYRECLAAALCAAIHIQSDAAAIIGSIPKITVEQTRARIYRVRNFYILDDAYNASYESINAALEQLFSLSEYKKKSILLGDVLELGEFSEEIHTKIGRLIARFSPERIYLYGKYAKYTSAGAVSMGFSRSDIYTFEIGDETKLAEKIKELTHDGEIMLAKGSRGMHLERIIEYIKL